MTLETISDNVSLNIGASGTYNLTITFKTRIVNIISLCLHFANDNSVFWGSYFQPTGYTINGRNLTIHIINNSFAAIDETLYYGVTIEGR